MDKQWEGFAYLRQKFPKINETRIKEGIFAGLQIKQLFEDKDLSVNLCSTDRRAWKAFENVFRNS